MDNTYKKIYLDALSALSDLKSGHTIMSGGFGLCGIPENSIDAIAKMDIQNLSVISNNIGNAGKGLVKILVQNKITKAYCSYVGGNPDLERLMLNNEIEVELIPQGTFAERIRAAGVGIRAFYTPKTSVAEGKEIRVIDDRPCLLEKALYADFAIIKAQRGDPYGNIWFKESARNFLPLMAMAANITVVEVEELVELGEMLPEDIHLPGIFIQRIYQGKNYLNQVEFPITRDEGAKES